MEHATNSVDTVNRDSVFRQVLHWKINVVNPSKSLTSLPLEVLEIRKPA